jgi:hypothetical protein
LPSEPAARFPGLDSAPSIPGSFSTSSLAHQDFRDTLRQSAFAEKIAAL